MNIDKIYSDFITNIAPKIQEGLVITKEYFTDLFGRYIKYLIVMDSIGIATGIFTILMALVVLYLFRNDFKKWDEDMNPLVIIIPVLIGIEIVGGFISSYTSTQNLIKDIYIPEVRVIEEIGKQMNNN